MEGQSVYWMSLEALAKIVLNKIRKLMFHFLWSSHSDTQHLHLCRWEVLSRPKNLKGWGFRNLNIFNLVLNASTLWRVLNQTSLWQKVVNNKYLKNTTLINWLRQPSHHCTSPLKIWSSLIRALPIILHWLRWCPGASSLIVVVRDKILGMGEISLLSVKLLTALKEKNITTLAHTS
jgi:hypothetical protein